MKFFKVSDLLVLMTIKLSSVSSRVTAPQLPIVTQVSRNKIRPEEDSHLVRLSSKKKGRKKKKMGQMFYCVSDLEVKSVTVNFNINANCPCHRSAIFIIGRICLIHFRCYNIDSAYF